MEGPRVGPGRDRAHPRREGRLGGLGGLGRAPRPRRPLPPRPPQAAREVRLQLLALRPLRPGLHPHPDRLRPEDPRASKHFREFLDEAGDLVVRYGGSISGEHGDGQSKAALLPKMFGDELVRAFGEFKAIWDPDNKMNPHKVVDPYLPGENLRLGPALPPAPGRDPLQVPRRQGELRLRDRAVRGHRRVPQGGERHDVPELHGHQGGDALDPRPGPPALRDAPGRPDEGGLEERAGPRGARPLPGVQGVPDRVPDERRHGDLQGRVPLPLLRGAAAAPARLRDGLDLLVGPARLARARAGRTSITHTPGARQGAPGAGRDLDQADDALVRARDVQGLVPPPAATERRARPGGALARHVQQPLPPADGEGGRRGAGGRRLPGRRARGGRSAAAGRSTTSACSRRPRRCSARSSTRCGPRSRRARRSSAWSRAAWPSSATS